MGFLRHLEKIRDKVGMLIFEFSHFDLDDFVHGREFVSLLDEFFEAAPPGWEYGVEVRNRNLLHPEYFGMLARHGVAHVYNQWTRMPPVTEQLRLLDPRAQSRHRRPLPPRPQAHLRLGQPRIRPLQPDQRNRSQRPPVHAHPSSITSWRIPAPRAKPEPGTRNEEPGTHRVAVQTPTST